MTIRPETPADRAAIGAVLEAAFPSPAEARLVDLLRDHGRLFLSLVAEEGGEVVGHIAFSPVSVAGTGADAGMGLAPVAVRPDAQRRGIGSRLVREGLAACREAGVGFVVLLGDPGFYGRFGFSAARLLGLSDEYGGGDAFQVLELATGAVPAGGGLVRYAPEFAMFLDEPGDAPPP